MEHPGVSMKNINSCIRGQLVLTPCEMLLKSNLYKGQ